MGGLQELIAAYEPFRGQRIIVALEGAPDPDSISSALAHEHILSSLGIETTVVHARPVSHQENRAAMKLLDITFMQYTGGALPDAAGYALVDSQRPDEGLAAQLAELPLISRVDHHEPLLSETVAAQYEDVRPELGATATIYAEYLREGGLLAQNKEGERVATALLLGIATDTKDFLRATPEDFAAAAFLAGFAKLDTYRAISEESLSEKGLSAFARGVDPARQLRIGSYVLSSAGVLTKSDADVIPQIADLLVHVDGTHTVVVYGIVDDIVRGSVRTSSAKERPQEFIHETFPEVKRYGGKHEEGGFLIPLNEFSRLLDRSDMDLIEQNVDRYLQNRFRERFNENGK